MNYIQGLIWANVILQRISLKMLCVCVCVCIQTRACAHACACMSVSTVYALIFSLEELLGHRADMSVVARV